MLNIGNDPKSWEKYQYVGPNDESINGEAILNFIDTSNYKSLKTYTIDFWFKKDNNEIEQRLLEISDSIKTISISLSNNNAIELSHIDNSEGSINELAHIENNIVDFKNLEINNNWCHFSFAFSEVDSTLILHLNGKKIYAGSDITNLSLEEFHLYSHTKLNPIYYALIRINKNVRFPEDTYDLDIVSKPYTTYINISELSRDVYNSNRSSNSIIRYFNGKINDNTVVFQPFHLNDENYSPSSLKDLFDLKSNTNTKIYPNETVVDNPLWNELTGSIGPLTDTESGELQYEHNEDKWNIYNWTADFWFKRNSNTDEIIPLIFLTDLNIFTTIYTKNNKLLIKTYDKYLTPEDKKENYYSIEIQGNVIKAIKFDSENNTLDSSITSGDEISNDSTLSIIYNNNDWNHLAITYEEYTHKLKLYINGILIYSLEEYLTYVLRKISLNLGKLSDNTTYISSFRLSAIIEFKENFNINELKQYPYDTYATFDYIYRAKIDVPHDTLEDILTKKPLNLQSTYQTAGGYLSATSQDEFEKTNPIYESNGKGYFEPVTESKNDVMVNYNGSMVGASNDIPRVIYYSEGNKHFFPLNDNGTTNTYSLVDLPFSKSIPDPLWNAITAKAGVKSPYDISSSSTETFENAITIPGSDADWSSYYALGPNALNSVNPAVLSLNSRIIPDPVWTCEFWFMRNKPNLNKPIDFFEVLGTNTNNSVRLDLSSNGINYCVKDNAQVYYPEITRTNIDNLIGSWNHFAMTYYNPSSTATIFINGNPIYTSTTVSNLLPSQLKVNLQYANSNNTLITAFKLNSGLKYSSPFNLNLVSVPAPVYVNVSDMPRYVEVYKHPVPDDPNQKIWVFNGGINDRTVLYFPIQGSNKEYPKETPIDYNTGILRYDDPYLVEATNSKNYNNMLVNNNNAWTGFNPIGPSQSESGGNIHITNTSGHKSPSGKYTVEFWMYRGPKKST